MLDSAYILEVFAEGNAPETYAAGDVIFRAGEKGDRMFAVVAGEVELQVDGVVKETITAGHAFGEGALVQESGLRATTAVAKTDCQLAFIGRERFLFLVQETPLFALKLLRSFSNRLRALKGVS